MSKTSAIENLRTIKQSLHAMMNGVASRSMREKGLIYRINYGVELPRLQAFATTFTPDAGLAGLLWKEDIRECRLLAPMLMPEEAFAEDLAEEWVLQLRFPEEADVLVFYLLRRMNYASNVAFRWLAAEEDLLRYTALQILTRLLTEGFTLTTRDAHEFLDQARAQIQEGPLFLRHAACRAVERFADQGLPQERMAASILQMCEEQ
ncbi:MAG: DNA alkylation repair protein [Alloprevotella sp.]|nr:DNA alkylation repair protein [Alloprevotella sp.]